MAKSIIFKRIKGRIVPIIIRSSTNKAGEAVTVAYQGIKPKPLNTVGKIGSMPYSGTKKMHITGFNVKQSFQRKGIGKELFDNHLSHLSASGKTAVRAYITNPATVKIMEKYTSRFFSSPAEPFKSRITASAAKNISSSWSTTLAKKGKKP